MAFDGIVTRAVISELKDIAIGARVNQIYQTEDDEIYIRFRSDRKNYNLLLSVNSSSPRFYLTEYTKDNPLQPPMFTMIMRKHLNSSFIKDISQDELDRTVFIDFLGKDDLGLESEKRLIIEIMGRHSNIILIEKSDNMIIDSIFRIPEHISRVRQILPGLKYISPPSQDKINPLNLNRDEFIKLLNKEDNELYRFLYQNYMGLSPLIAREICHKANIDESTITSDLNEEEINNLYKVFSDFMADVKANKYEPNLVYNEDETKALAFHALEINQYKNSHKDVFKSISKMLDFYYYERERLNQIRSASQSILRIVLNNIDRNKNKLNKQNIEYGQSLDREKYKIYGDIINANIYRIEDGVESVELENFYEEDMPLIEIEMDKRLNPQENAQKYYKRYSRLRNRNKLLKREIPKTKHELDYLENILVNIENTNDIRDLEEIRDELISGRYIKKQRKNKNKRNHKSEPHHYKSSDGIDIFVGKNNLMNDELTFRKSHSEDTWMHARNIPGSHVIIKMKGEIPENTLLEAAALAAYYSKSRNDSLVDIDYTERKHVKKIPGGKPGMVTYENFNTIAANPNIKLLKDIEKLK